VSYIYVGATPEVDGDVLAAIRDSVAAEFGEPVPIIALPSVDFAFDAARGQYHSVAVLEMLARRCPPDARKFLAIIGRDLFVPVLTFVFGQAQLGGKLAVVSLARLEQEFYGLAPDRTVLRERARKEVLHELGHTYGLVHCADRKCAMSLATNVRQIDSKQAAYCPACAVHLRAGARE
jgi:archaemetzincin